jgi:hypothetical protein
MVYEAKSPVKISSGSVARRDLFWSCSINFFAIRYTSSPWHMCNQYRLQDIHYKWPYFPRNDHSMSHRKQLTPKKNRKLKGNSISMSVIFWHDAHKLSCIRHCQTDSLSQNGLQWNRKQCLIYPLIRLRTMIFNLHLSVCLCVCAFV